MPLVRLLIIMLVICYSQDALCENNVFAIINNIYPDNSLNNGDVEVIRGSDDCKILSKIELCENDMLKVNNINTYIELLINFKEKQLITYDMAGKEPYLLKSKNRSYFNNAMSAIAGLDIFYKESLKLVKSNVRGEELLPLRVRVNDCEQSKLMSSKRRLHVRWEGGKPPFTVVFIKDNRVLYKSEHVNTYSIFTSEIYWPEGEVMFALLQNGDEDFMNPTDKIWIDKSVYFVDKSEVPLMPESLCRLDIDENFKTLLYSNWLSKENNGTWAWEALQIASAIEDDFLPAKIWIDCLD